MSSDHDASKSTYNVGYRKPPPDGRFKPGQSGNPKGRPRTADSGGQIAPLGSEPTAALIRAIGRRPIKVRIGGKMTKIMQLEAVIQGQFQKALGGNRFAIRDIINLVSAHDAADAALVADHVGKIRRYQTGWWDDIAEAKYHGLPEPNPVPHPDDIAFGPHCEIMYNGPKDPREQRLWDRLQERADAADKVIDQLLDMSEGRPKLVRTVFDELVHAHRMRLRLRLIAPDEETRRSPNYHRPTDRELEAQNKRINAEYRNLAELTPDEVRAFIKKIKTESFIRQHRRTAKHGPSRGSVSSEGSDVSES